MFLEKRLKKNGRYGHGVVTGRPSMIKEVKGRAGTLRFTQRSSNTLLCRVNVRVNDEKRRDSCSLRVRLADRLLDRREKKKEVLELSRELGELDAAGPTTLGAALDAGERSGPRWTGDAWLARRRRYSTARRDRAMT